MRADAVVHVAHQALPFFRSGALGIEVAQALVADRQFAFPFLHA